QQNVWKRLAALFFKKPLEFTFHFAFSSVSNWNQTADMGGRVILALYFKSRNASSRDGIAGMFFTPPPPNSVS
ncbi:MAG TPA: hypothetical protein DC001_01730, partial [Clostridiales bacterium]|nr:hypothetical protein [Clostridiales bacterium]